MQLQFTDAVDAVVVAPLLAGAIGAGDHEPVQNGEEDGAFDGKREVAIGEQLIENRAALGVAPQALEQQRRADAHAAEAGDAGLVDGERMIDRCARRAAERTSRSRSPRRSTSSLRPRLRMMRCLTRPSSRTVSTRQT